MQSELETAITRMETSIADLKVKRQQLEALAVAAKDMPEAMSKIEALRERMDAGIAHSERLLEGAKIRVEATKQSLIYMERVLREVDESIKKWKQDKR